MKMAMRQAEVHWMIPNTRCSNENHHNIVSLILSNLLQLAHVSHTQNSWGLRASSEHADNAKQIMAMHKLEN